MKIENFLLVSFEEQLLSFPFHHQYEQIDQPPTLLIA